MSPPLAAAETKNDTDTPVKPKKPISERQRIANPNNGRRGRGPVTTAGKKRSRLNACKHYHRSELPLLPGENGPELQRRLAVWPEILGAETEIEHFAAVQAVHFGLARGTLRSLG